MRRGRRGRRGRPIEPSDTPTLHHLPHSSSDSEEIEEEIMAEVPQNGGNGNRNGNGQHEGQGENIGHNRMDGQPRGRTIKELTQSDGNFYPLPGAFPTFNTDFEIKGQLIHSLPKFHGLAGENPYLHLRAIYMQCMSMKPVGANIDDVMWKVFHLSLEGKAREWYMNLPLYVDNAYKS